MHSSKKAWQNDEENLIIDLLKTAHEVPKIKAYLLEEISYLKNSITPNSSVIDFGCGNGRHLKILETDISQGLGIDMNRSYLEEASALCSTDTINFEVGDIEKYQPAQLFDVAIAMYNTFGNIENQKGMIESMMRSVKDGGKVIISIFSPESVPSRLEMYKIMGFENLDIQGYKITTEEGFHSECFTEATICELMPNARIEKCTDIGWIVVLEKENNATNK